MGIGTRQFAIDERVPALSSWTVSLGGDHGSDSRAGLLERTP